MSKLQVYHFHNGSGGGVLSVIKNLIRYSENSSIENHIIYTINKDVQKEYKIEKVEKAITEHVFYYSSKNNFYYTCKQLSKLLPNDKAVIVAHDWLELGMVSNLGLNNPVVFYLHGDYDYYYNLAILNKASINLFIAVSESIKVTLQKKNVERTKDIYYLRFPVPKAFALNNVQKIKKYIIFIGRLTEEKGYYLLPKIAKILNVSSTKFAWHIVGINPNKEETNNLWEKDIDVRFYGNIENEEVRNLLTEMDYFILPSLSEGTPVSLVEAMKAGVVPLVNNLKGGIEELIKDGITGFQIQNNNIVGYVNKITWLEENINESVKIKFAAKQLADSYFDPQKNTNDLEDLLLLLVKDCNERKATKLYGSRLDEPWIPNAVSKFLRN